MKHIMIPLLMLFFVPEVFSQAGFEELQKFKENPALKHASWSFCLRDAETGNVELEFDSERSLVPASTMKAVTTMTALALLGRDYRFKTWMLSDAAVDSQGVLMGNLYLAGGGDPTIGSSRFAQSTLLDTVFYRFYKALKARGIRKIDGDIIAWDLHYELNPLSYAHAWGDMGNYYGAGSFSLNIFENLCAVTFRAGNTIAEKAECLQIDPMLQGVQVFNKVRTGRAGSGDNTLIYSAPYGNYMIMEGTVPAGNSNFVVKASIPDPPLVFLKEFRKFLLGNGIEVTGDNYKESVSGKERSLIKADTIYVHLSPPLKDIVRKTNIASINIFADALLKLIAFEEKGQGSFQTGIDILMQYWKNKGIDLGGFFMADGSGLSRRNLISTKTLTDMLYHFQKEAGFQAFYSSLPLAGIDGTIRNMFKNTCAESNLRSKSGTMSGIRAYCGYFKNKSDKEKVFAIIVNNYSGTSAVMRSSIEKLLVSMAEGR
jgi:serine-type D-Ala-D-Ala carboxypeptidase/endopeptidase (penicillin-binding protein 4)